MDRFAEIIKSLPLDGKGLEIAPLYRPSIKRPPYNVDYTDYTTTEVLREKSKNHPDIASMVEIDFVWKPGKRLKDCAGDRRYDYAIASHVWEHIPNPVGWLEQVLEVCNVGAVVSLVLPTRYNPMDYLRRETNISELVASYVENRANPSPQQIFDCLYNVRKYDKRIAPDLDTKEFAALPGYYTPQSAAEFAVMTLNPDIYLDAHCSVFSIHTIADLFAEVQKVGLLLNIEVLEVSSGPEDPEGLYEFFVKLKKIPGPARAVYWDKAQAAQYVASPLLFTAPGRQGSLARKAVSATLRFAQVSYMKKMIKAVIGQKAASQLKAAIKSRL